MRVFDVLGTPLLATTYQELTAECQRLARSGGTWAIDFSNTHTVTLRRHDSQFRRLTHCFDLVLPDGMPLVWCLNRHGANLTDRVYGPTFMRKILEDHSRSATHYLIGGSQECGLQLRNRFPQARIVGAFHGQCSGEGILEGTEDERVIAEINHLGPDFIWVGLGTPKQYEWINRNKSRINHGVLLAVGFAFDVNAGTKADAPEWMQRRGLTWLFRALSEPRRLPMRYLRYNSLFLSYLLKDALIKSP
ncbi:MAG: WecB/TagA/CpsF family glycosyltransferase [Chthoniobacterales bacterium]